MRQTRYHLFVPRLTHVLLTHLLPDPPGHLGRGNEGPREEEEHLPLDQGSRPLPAEEGPGLHAPSHALDRGGVHVAEGRNLAKSRDETRQGEGGEGGDKHACVQVCVRDCVNTRICLALMYVSGRIMAAATLYGKI